MAKNRVLRTILILAVAGLAIAGSADSLSKDYAQQALTRALATFAVARTLNGVISVAQGTEVALEPGGVGVIMTPGQILDPINDLVERFSSVMLVAASSIGLQLVLLEITSWIWVTVLLCAGLAVWLACTWSEPLHQRKYMALIIRLTLLLAFVRFAVPVVIIATNLLFHGFLETRHDQATAELRGTSAEIERLNTRDEAAGAAAQPGNAEPSAAESESSMLESLRSAAEGWYSGVSDWIGEASVTTRIRKLQESAANAAGGIVELIVVFVLDTVIFPLAFLWLFMEILKALAGRLIPAMRSTSPGHADR